MGQSNVPLGHPIHTERQTQSETKLEILETKSLIESGTKSGTESKTETESETESETWSGTE